VAPLGSVEMDIYITGIFTTYMCFCG